MLSLTDGKPLDFLGLGNSTLCIYQLKEKEGNEKIFIVNLRSSSDEAVHIPCVFRSAEEDEVCICCAFVNNVTGVFENTIFIG